jgi:hypothetical protein
MTITPTHLSQLHRSIQSLAKKALTLLALSVGAASSGALAAGPDVVLKDINQLVRFGELNGYTSYSFANVSCNIGNADLGWQISGSPVMGLNMYRLKDGTLTQIGQSSAKRSLFAVASDGCGPCNGNDNNVLGAGCQDVYNAYYNGAAGNLGPRFQINAFSGAVQTYTPLTGDVLFRRLQVPTSTVDNATNAQSLYFAEGVFVATDDAAAGNSLNNASYKRIALQPGSQFVDVGDTSIGRPAIYSWRDHGNGANSPDTSVDIHPVDVPGEGRFYVATKARPAGNGYYRYDYAIFNLNSDLCAGGLEIPLGTGNSVSNVGYNAPRSHSGEPYSNDPWIWWRMSEGSVRFRTARTHSENPNENAVRWGTMYNFWFISDAAPTAGTIRMHLFKPWPNREINVPATVPTPRVAGSSCDSIDFDNDGLFPTDNDLIEYFAVMAGDDCSNCNSIDFNNDGIYPSDDDTVAFLRVLAGGSCQ